jgi:hypothetical protein
MNSSILESLKSDPCLVSLGSKAMNGDTREAATYHVKGTEFFFFVLITASEEIIRIFERRDPDDLVEDPLDVLLTCSIISPEKFLEEQSDSAASESVIFNLNIFAGV